MKLFSIKGKTYIPASHEDPENPGALKIILADKTILNPGTRLQMINWALLPKDKHFESHFHEDMEEIFIIISGTVEIESGGERKVLEKGDGVHIGIGEIHTMKNIGSKDANYIVMGFSLGRGGKTINVKSNEK